MGPAPHKQPRGSSRFRFIYINRFGSHRCGSVLKLGSRRRRGRGQEQARAEAQARGASPGRPAPVASTSTAPAACAASASIRPQASRAPTQPGLIARAGVSQKKTAKTYDFPIPSPEASEIRKKRKKASVWKDVHKVISRMMEENENYRLRLNCPKPATTNSH
ncbi:uncharacterized protein C5orf47 homolog [Thomomys bottae]